GLYGIWEVRNLFVVKFIGIVNVFFSKYLADAVGAKANPRATTFLEGATFHLTQLPNTLAVPGLALFVTGLVFAYLYRDERFAIPAVFLPVAFLILATKGLNRYFMPFFPMAIIVAGYGVDRLRRIAAAQQERAGNLVFAAILVASAAVMFQSGAAMISSSAQGFTGIDEAGQWIQQNAAEDAVVIAASSNQIRFFSQRPTIHAGSIKNRSELSRVLQERNVRYIELDTWESTQPTWLLRTVIDEGQISKAFKSGEIPQKIRRQLQKASPAQRTRILFILAADGGYFTEGFRPVKVVRPTKTGRVVVLEVGR
ncbi:MAG: hypothetical protein SVY41_01300, partial [Candidatus Nanohaloarchaea archaeon]|nr:hypothetical protein [Candidatus Nanohaloarchaea archaeon]